MLYLAQGEDKNKWWGSKPRNPTCEKFCASVIVRVANAASLNLEPSTWTLKSSPNFPLLQDAQFLFGIFTCECCIAGSFKLV
jgi:hypothetical protein